MMLDDKLAVLRTLEHTSFLWLVTKWQCIQILKDNTVMIRYCVKYARQKFCETEKLLICSYNGTQWCSVNLY